MRKSALSVYTTPSDEFKSVAEQCGYACVLMSLSHTHANRPMQYLTEVIEPAIAQKNIKFYFNDEGQVVGYVVWAYLASDVENRFLKTGQLNLHPSEWNEGISLWIIDLLSPFGNIKHILRSLRDTLFPDTLTIRYFRVKKGKIIVKQISRGSCSHFFKKQR